MMSHRARKQLTKVQAYDQRERERARERERGCDPQDDATRSRVVGREVLERQPEEGAPRHRRTRLRSGCRSEQRGREQAGDQRRAQAR